MLMIHLPERNKQTKKEEKKKAWTKNEKRNKTKKTKQRNKWKIKIRRNQIDPQTNPPTFQERGGEPGFLHRSVRHKLDPHLVGHGLDILGRLVAAEHADQRCVFLMSVANVQVVVNTVIVLFDLWGERWGEGLSIERIKRGFGGKGYEGWSLGRVKGRWEGKENIEKG